jgi:hypothetical protein
MVVSLWACGDQAEAANFIDCKWAAAVPVAIQSEVNLVENIDARQGDWVRRMRFWGESTRGVEAPVRQRPRRAHFAPKPGRLTQSPCLTLSGLDYF